MSGVLWFGFVWSLLMLDWRHSFGRHTTEMMVCDIDPHHSVQVVSAGLRHCRVTVFPFVVNEYIGDIFRCGESSFFSSFCQWRSICQWTLPAAIMTGMLVASLCFPPSFSICFWKSFRRAAPAPLLLILFLFFFVLTQKFISFYISLNNLFIYLATSGLSCSVQAL